MVIMRGKSRGSCTVCFFQLPLDTVILISNYSNIIFVVKMIVLGHAISDKNNHALSGLNQTKKS